jgi:hypothetical protein
MLNLIKPDAVTLEPEDPRDSVYATLNHRAITTEATNLVDQIASLVADQERLTKIQKAELTPDSLKTPRTYQRGPKGEQKLWDAVEGLLGDLLAAVGNDQAQGWTFRRLRRDDFSRERVTFRTFKRLTEALVELELLDHLPGSQRLARDPFPDGPKRSYIKLDGGMSSRYRATESLLTIAQREGIHAANVDLHFTPRLPQKPLVLMSASYWVGADKVDGRRQDYLRNTKTKEMETEVKALNAFLDTFLIEGGSGFKGFHGFIRIFNQGDIPGFDWNKGGRLYGDFQLLPDVERLEMTIGTEPVVEIDISASYLTLLHGLQGLPFAPESDAYSVGGFDRVIIKAWLTATLGHNKHFEQWPDESVRRLQKAGIQDPEGTAPIKMVRAAMESRYPVLKEWPEQRLTWADLMFAEAKAIIAAMTELMSESIPSLCVHDSVLVRQRDEERTKDILSARYKEVCGINPRLKVAS